MMQVLHSKPSGPAVSQFGEALAYHVVYGGTLLIASFTSCELAEEFIQIYNYGPCNSPQKYSPFGLKALLFYNGDKVYDTWQIVLDCDSESQAAEFAKLLKLKAKGEFILNQWATKINV